MALTNGSFGAPLLTRSPDIVPLLGPETIIERPDDYVDM